MYPCLIPKWSLNAVVDISLTSDGISEDGEELTDILLEDVKCNIQFKSQQKLTAKKELITISGKACFIGDICPSLQAIKGGTLNYNGVEYDIYKGRKNLNFDGTVNYTELELK